MLKRADAEQSGRRSVPQRIADAIDYDIAAQGYGIGERLIAEPGSEMYGSISVVAQCVANVRKMATLPPECFWPRPEVTSVMMVLQRLHELRTDDPLALAEFCKRAFAGRRKQLRGLLKSMGLDGVPLPPGVPPEARIESLTPDQISGLERSARAR